MTLLFLTNVTKITIREQSDTIAYTENMISEQPTTCYIGFS